jgi:hypothetical protein
MWCVLSVAATGQEQPGRWPVERAQAWAAGKPWLVGCNYAPRSAINQLEMWQFDTFDLATIDQELQWAEDLGFTSIRVFLHHLLWDQDKEGFLQRMDQFLTVADRHRIGVLFVPFDSVWDPEPAVGRQRDPKPGVHNSGWVQSPGAAILGDPARHDEMKGYVQGILTRFKDDGRIHGWDLINEPDNTNGNSYGKKEPRNKPELALQFLRKVWGWAREVNPSQPLTSGVWIGTWSDEGKLSAMERFQLENSDIISFHSYAPLDEMKKCVESLRRYNRPIWCTEYMARPRGSTFDPILGYLKEQKVGAYCWGFVAGKTQTNYPWDSWQKPYASEPEVWFHEIFRPNGKPYRQEEVDYIKSLTLPRP